MSSGAVENAHDAGRTEAPRCEPRRNVAVHAPDCMGDFVPDSEWEVFGAVIRLAQQRGQRFAISGGFATSFYSAFWRNTKDLDFCVLPRDREAWVRLTTDAGLHDLHDEKPYDRGWIYRSTGRGVIVDVIWQLANRCGEVDDDWLERGPEVVVHGDTMRLVPPEELIWSKLHVVQRERCDFPDIVNILHACGRQLDWSRLLARVGREERLLASVVSLFAWLAPGRARSSIPDWAWRRLGLQVPAEGKERDEDRIRRIDSRPWYSPV